MAPTRQAIAIAALAAAGALAPATALAGVASGPHEVLRTAFTTKRTSAPTGSIYDVRYRNPDNPNENPPAVRRVVIVSPLGSRVDTSVPARCDATDLEFQVLGDAACPKASRVGGGSVTVSVLGGPPGKNDISLYNVAGGLVQLVKAGPFGVAVVRTKIRGRTYYTRIPTCLSGGQPPDGCPFDEAVVLASPVVTNKVVVGGRSYLTTPPRCPAGGWRTKVTFTYADGTVESVVTKAGCTATPAGGGGGGSPGGNGGHGHRGDDRDDDDHPDDASR